jgi:predicted acylesterase/phospholipase RssA
MNTERAKLGLALAGGGFRASLFHVGVLRRMAELDLLRFVQVLSTVSGGSIVGALYILLLKRHLEDAPYDGQGPDAVRLPQQTYVEIVDDLQKALVEGIRKNLRTRLLMNPFVLLKVMLSGSSLAGEMGRLYEKHIYASAIADLRAGNAKIGEGRLPLTAIRLRQQEVSEAGGTDQYNVQALDPAKDKPRGGPGSAATKLVLNATTLNSGARFWFAHTEIGDWYLGHVRRDEIASELLPRKVLLDLSTEDRKVLLDPEQTRDDRKKVIVRVGWARNSPEPYLKWIEDKVNRPKVEFVQWMDQRKRERALARATLRVRWFSSPQVEAGPPAALPMPWDGPLNPAGDFVAFIDALWTSDAGRLREAKNQAWYLSKGRGQKDPKTQAPRPVTSGMDDSELWMLFWDALKAIDEGRATKLEQAFDVHLNQHRAEPKWCQDLFAWVLEVYYCRTAAVVSPTIEAEWKRLTLAEAVAASAAFPPVFPPFQLHDIYDDAYLQVLSLTDGGAFDNIGVTMLLDEHCNFIIASDTGAVFDDQQSKAAVGRLAMMGRLLELLLNRPTQLYRHELNERRRLGRVLAAARCPKPSFHPPAITQFAASREICGLAAFQISSPPVSGPVPSLPDSRLIAGIRTDLDLFGSVEMECLINQGYVVADQYLRAGFRGSAVDSSARTVGAPEWGPVAAVPYPMDLAKLRVLRRVHGILGVGRSRIFRSLMLGAPLSVALTLLAALALVWVTWTHNVQWAQLYAWISKGIVWVVTTLLTWEALVDLVQRIELKYVVAIALLALIVWLAFGRARTDGSGSGAIYVILRQHAGLWRKFMTVSKTLKSYKGNLLWLFKLLPLTILVVPVVAIVSHFFFAKPFERKTRDPQGLDRVVRIPRNYSFKAAAQTLAGQCGVEFVGFTQQELSAPLQAKDIAALHVAEAIRQLHNLAKGHIREYTVEHSSSGKYIVRVP